MGHLTLLGLRSPVPGYPTPGGTLQYGASDPHWDLARAMRAARAHAIAARTSSGSGTIPPVRP